MVGRGGRFSGKSASKPICQICGRIGHLAMKYFKWFDISFNGLESGFFNASDNGYSGYSHLGHDSSSGSPQAFYIVHLLVHLRLLLHLSILHLQLILIGILIVILPTISQLIWKTCL